MAHPKIDDENLLAALTRVFRSHGYEGASLSRLTAATGLQRASLYHRFPGGKKDMALAVMRRAETWLQGHVLGPLEGTGAPATRIRKMARALDEFYEGGGAGCLLDALSLGEGEDLIRNSVRTTATAWTEALAGVAREAGLRPREARIAAQEGFMRIQGALVLARATGDREPFKRVLKELPAQLAR